jgi:hypothetical protein
MALKDAPQTCLMNLPHKSMTSWKDLCHQFVANFMPTYERPATKNDLKAVHQYKGKTLRQYIQRFSQMRNKIPRISNEEVISAFSAGVSDIKMREKLSVNDELTSVGRLFEIANHCAKAEEGRLFMHNLPEALPLKPKSKDPKQKEAAVLMVEPDYKQCHGDRSERDKGRYRRYCILRKKDTHDTNDCWIVQKFHEENGVSKRRWGGRSYGKSGSRGDCHDNDHEEGRRHEGLPRADPESLPLPPPANDHREENQGGYQEPRDFATCLLGGAQAPLSNRHFKQLSREIAVALPNVGNRLMKWSMCKIGFDEEDHPASTRGMGTPTINNATVN